MPLSRVLASSVFLIALLGTAVSQQASPNPVSGPSKGKVFGRMRAMSHSGNLLLVENEKGVADLYDAATLKSLAHYSFPDRIAHARFLASDSALMVLTADQTVYRLQVPAVTAAVGFGLQRRSHLALGKTMERPVK